MRVRGVAWQQRTLLLECREVRWVSLPEEARREVLTLLSRLLLDYARTERGFEGRERS